MSKQLLHIIQGLATKQVIGSLDAIVTAVSIDSRQCAAGTCFVAIKGSATDGHAYIEKVIGQGCTIVVCSSLPALQNNDVTYILVQDTAKAAGEIASNFYNQPSQHLKLVGVTGTNGKTTVATLLYQLFTKLGYACGLISTVHNIINGNVIPSTHTTPDAISLQSLLAQMKAAGCAFVFMEVSSHAAHQQRIAGCEYAGALFTNITHDHLDYHGTFDEYIAAKKMFFDGLSKAAFAISNADDKRGAIMLQNTAAQKYFYSIKNLAQFKARMLDNTVAGLHLYVDDVEVHCKMVGEFNAYNLLLVYAAAVCLEQPKQEVLAVLSTLQGARGRFEITTSTLKNITGIIDYAHTPDALLNVLATIKQLNKERKQVITIVGCGGNRDATKRPIMAQVACEYSNQVVLTSDNPRTEDPAEILKQMNAGVPPQHANKVLTIADRQAAITTACKLATPGDIILIAGKGHETYQEVNGIKLPFDDKEILLNTFQLLQL